MNTLPTPTARWLKLALPVVIILAGITVSVLLIKSPPRAGTAAPPDNTRLVNTLRVEKAEHRPVVEVMGQVVAKRQVTLYPQVSGEIIQVSPALVPGYTVSVDETVIHLDNSDYRIALQRMASNVAKANADLLLEQGQQAIARQEYELTGRKLSPADESLVLRQPQLQAAEAALALAEADLAQANLSLERTTIKPPFDGQVVNLNVELGSFVNTSTALLEMVDVSEFRLEASVSVEQLQWLTGGDSVSGSPVKVYSPSWPDSQFRNGYVLSVSPSLEAGTRMARVLIAIPDPLALKPENHQQPAVRVNDYLRADIQGPAITDVVALPREHLHNGNTVWLMSHDNTLEVRTVAPVFTGQDTVLIANGITTGEHIVTSALPAPVPGLPLRTREAPSEINKLVNVPRPKGDQPL
ncbi:efflux RND transporter periplasmic adaptor subunit [Kistimonas scapharcae]|uniref:Efflux RND transporter periplasmic adaptor subunit n=1 Tax=Kistimonas scapharcae TaxID=1036133 RepID=A0ABP8V894_9GAMM